MVMSQSLYIDLKSQYPDSEIDVLAPAWCKPVLERMPEVSQSIEMPIGHGDISLKERYLLGKSLREKQYTHAYVLPNSAKSALIPMFAKIPNRIGWKGEMRYGLLTDLRPNKKQFQYMIERYVALARPKHLMQSSSSLGGLDTLPFPKLSVSKESQTAISSKLKLSRNKPIVGLCPGAEFGPAKQWPVEHFASVANSLIAKGYDIWILGSKNDATTGQEITKLTKEKSSIHDLTGQTNLIEAIDLISCCSTIISNDSGAMHLAAAVGCKIIGIYGSTSPDYTPPLTKNLEILHTDIECRPCFKKVCPYGHLKCLKDLEPLRVMDAFMRLTNEQDRLSELD
ncbi:lipopolysaccharide heptosyltransferase II [Vibrio sp. UCD-FRSSP16_10]|uniref:lipopolysaccharide heptosyltransferase II n=1 Tax=unclassified Vibrio TaxID=2614977 RepID=UPI0008006762|nr:lipopolysaccharide heptosyltransferase II [Vibrio sp. UCD-FRSSP16_30]OBT19006.1 lipopolysaccharide heptosyltransferase II [Vibrio sp. UCD-FRSSP16_10]